MAVFRRPWQLLRLLLLGHVDSQCVSRQLVKTIHGDFLDDQVRFVDHLYENNRRTLNYSQKSYYELNMVAEQGYPRQGSAAEPSRRRARTDRMTAMEVDVPDDDDDLGEGVTVTEPPLPTTTAHPTSSASTSGPTSLPTGGIQRRMDPKLLDKPDGFDGVGTSWRVLEIGSERLAVRR